MDLLSTQSHLYFQRVKTVASKFFKSLFWGVSSNPHTPIFFWDTNVATSSTIYIIFNFQISCNYCHTKQRGKNSRLLQENTGGALELVRMAPKDVEI
jgi:hypothetical protein